MLVPTHIEEMGSYQQLSKMMNLDELETKCIMGRRSGGDT
jgi:hypothetical protein